MLIIVLGLSHIKFMERANKMHYLKMHEESYIGANNYAANILQYTIKRK